MDGIVGTETIGAGTIGMETTGTEIIGTETTGVGTIGMETIGTEIIGDTLIITTIELIIIALAEEVLLIPPTQVAIEITTPEVQPITREIKAAPSTVETIQIITGIQIPT